MESALVRYPVHLLQLNRDEMVHLPVSKRRVYVYYETRIELEFDGT